QVIAAAGRTRGAVFRLEERVSRAQGQTAQPELALGLYPLRNRLAEVVVGSELASRANTRGDAEAAHEPDQLHRVAPERGQLERRAAAIEADAHIVTAAALRLQRRVAVLGVKLEQGRRLEPLSVRSRHAPAMGDAPG